MHFQFYNTAVFDVGHGPINKSRGYATGLWKERMLFWS